MSNSFLFKNIIDRFFEESPVINVYTFFEDEDHQLLKDVINHTLKTFDKVIYGRTDSELNVLFKIFREENEQISLNLDFSDNQSNYESNDQSNYESNDQSTQALKFYLNQCDKLSSFDILTFDQSLDFITLFIKKNPIKRILHHIKNSYNFTIVDGENMTFSEKYMELNSRSDIPEFINIEALIESNKTVAICLLSDDNKVFSNELAYIVDGLSEEELYVIIIDEFFNEFKRKIIYYSPKIIFWNQFGTNKKNYFGLNSELLRVEKIDF
jgi:hypothetical protein